MRRHNVSTALHKDPSTRKETRSRMDPPASMASLMASQASHDDGAMEKRGASEYRKRHERSFLVCLILVLLGVLLLYEDEQQVKPFSTPSLETITDLPGQRAQSLQATITTNTVTTSTNNNAATKWGPRLKDRGTSKANTASPTSSPAKPFELAIVTTGEDEKEKDDEEIQKNDEKPNLGVENNNDATKWELKRRPRGTSKPNTASPTSSPTKTNEPTFEPTYVTTTGEDVKEKGDEEIQKNDEKPDLGVKNGKDDQEKNSLKNESTEVKAEEIVEEHTSKGTKEDSSISIPSECTDDKSYRVNGKVERDCNWIRKKPKLRCKGKPGASVSCPGSCNPNCPNAPSNIKKNA